MVEISVIVPVFNVEKYIKKCVDSIVSQTFSNIEIILVDDGSTDNSGIMCDEYAKIDSRIKVIHKKNGGLSSARNAGINIATGQYFGFIDSDDYIDKDMFELLHRNIIKEKADLSICGIYQCYEGKKPSINKPWYRILESEEAIRIAFEGKIFSVNAVNKLYKRELFENLRYPEGKTTEDAFVIVDILSECKKIVATAEQKYYYFHREGSITTIKSAANCFDCIEAYRRNKNLIDKNYPKISDVAMSSYCWSYFYALDRLLFAQDRAQYVAEEKDIIQFLRSNIIFIITKSKLAKSRKISAVALYINVKLYRLLLIRNTKSNIKLNA